MAYWDGSKVKTISLQNWDTSLGTLIGVVVIPQNILPDKKARIISLSPIIEKIYNFYSKETSNYVPLTSNIDNFANEIQTYISAILPSDKFTDLQSFVDPQAFYKDKQSLDLIPSPYLGNILNPEFCKSFEGNMFSNFDGLNITKEIIDYYIDKDYSNTFIHSVWNYNDGVSNLQWYLPTIGELAFLMARLKTIENSLGEDLSVGGLISCNVNYIGCLIIQVPSGELIREERLDLIPLGHYTTYPFAMI